MSILQKQVIQSLDGLSDENLQFLLDMILRFMKPIRILLKAFYSLKRLRSFWTFQKKTVLIKNVIALLFSALTAMVSRSAAMRMT